MLIRPVLIRPGRDSDAAGVIALIGRCWADYPNCILDVEDEPGLLAPASTYAAQGGPLWVAEDAGVVIGMVATVPQGGGDWEVCRVYAHPDLHGTGLGRRLLDTAEAHAAGAGATRLHLWTDTRFDRAHRFYEKRGYVRTGPIRALDGVPDVLEFGYAKPIEGVQVLDAAGAASAVRALADILVACVDGGAGISFLAPLEPAAARSHMAKAARDVAQGRCVLLAAWSRGVLAGTVRVQLDMAQNQPHRAEIAKLLVHPAHRGRGLARALMAAAEAEATRAGRTLLTLDTRTGDAGERLCHRLGWTEAGHIPGYAVTMDGTLHGTTIFYKTIVAGSEVA